MNREEKLAAKQREHRQLLEQRKPLIVDYNKAKNRLSKINKHIVDCGRAIYDLSNAGETPTVTDHAIVRYLERVKGVNLLELKAEIARHKQAVQVQNTIVTVNADDDAPNSNPRGDKP